MKIMSKTAAVMSAIGLAILASAPRADAQGVDVRVGPGGVGVSVGETRHRGRHYSWGPGFYFYDGYYHGQCSWLRSRAEETGSQMWWRRYRQCRQG
jgi:hypothetical protein